MRRLLPLLLCLGSICPPARSIAGEGVVEINATRAAAGGLNGDLQADPPGYPVVITESGSYALTGSLVSSQETLIVVAVNNVTLDLAGFDLQGGSGEFDCIRVDDPGFPRTGLTVRNGTIRGCRYGIDALAVERSRFETLRISGAASDGLRAGSFASAIDVDSSFNGKGGLVLGLRSESFRARATNNGATGIATGAYGLVRDSLATDNGEDGIRASFHSVVEDCTTDSNGQSGIRARGRIAGNISTDNGAGACANCDVCAGISAAGPSLVQGNQVRATRGSGIASLGENRIDGNHLTGRGTADGCPLISSSGGAVIVRNTAIAESGFSVVPFATTTSDIVGPILSKSAETSAPFANFTDQ